jgi:hypothetical protein
MCKSCQKQGRVWQEIMMGGSTQTGREEQKLQKPPSHGSAKSCHQMHLRHCGKEVKKVQKPWLE